MNKRTLIKQKILKLPKDYNENGYTFSIQTRKGVVDYKKIFDIFMQEDDIDIDMFRKEEVKALIIKEPK